MSLAYNAAGRLSSILDPRGPGEADDRVTTYTYDASGEHLVSVMQPGSRTTFYTYDTGHGYGREHGLVSVTYPDATSDRFAYDDLGRLTQATKSCCSGLEAMSYSYGPGARVVAVDGTGRETTLSYGLHGQLWQARDGEGRVVQFRYGDDLNLLEVTWPGGERTQLAYDANGDPTASLDALGRRTSFQYAGPFHQISKVTDARGNALSYSSDANGNLTAITYPDNSRELFRKDAMGNTSTYTNRRGIAVSFTYNAAGQLTSKDYANTPGVDYTYGYDSVGHLTNYSDGTGSTSLAYDPTTDRLSRIDFPGGKWFAFEYDPVGRRIRRTDEDGDIVGYTYDGAGRLDRMTNGSGQLIVDYDYDAAGRVTRKTLGNGVNTTYRFNAAGQITNLVNAKADGTVLSAFSYSYDATGRRVSMAVQQPRPGSAGGSWSESYMLDAVGQLTQVMYSATPGGLQIAWGLGYSYDAAGNRTEVRQFGGAGAVENYGVNALNQYTSAGDANFTYDLDGNFASKTEGGITTTFGYDAENRLVSVTTPTESWTYSYDAFGNRIGSTHNGVPTRYLFDPNNRAGWAAEFDAGGVKSAAYYYGYGLLTRKGTSGDPAFYTFSALGHTADLTDNAGDALNTYAFEPWGNPIRHEVSVPNPFEYVGEFGVATEGNGLLLMQARHYSPELGRFVQADPIGIGGGANVYAYANNRPSGLIDPNGMRACDMIALMKWLFGDSVYWGRFGGSGNLAWRSWSLIKAGWNGDWAELALAEVEVLSVGLSPAHLPSGWGVLKEMLHSSWAHIAKHALDDLGEEEDGGGDGGTDGNGSRGGASGGCGGSRGGGAGGGASGGSGGGSGSSGTATSFDPNDKLGIAGYGEQGFVTPDGTLSYQIRFENKADASAPARLVLVTDAIDPNLDLETFELTEIRFANLTITLPSGLRAYEDLVRLTLNDTLLFADVQAWLDHGTRTLNVTLAALDPLTGWYPEDPLVGLLYPDDDTGRGEGSVSFRIFPTAGLPSGTRIENRARIVFDYNDPIDTPLVFNTIDSGAPSSRVSPIVAPAFGTNIFTVTWTAEDDPGGSGVANVDLYGSSDGTNYVRWAQGLTNEVAFTGTYGSTYSLFTVARDHVGNEEAWPAAPDATVHIPRVVPEIDSVTLETDGRLRMHALGAPGVAYGVQASTDLIEWAEIGVITADSAGQLEFLDPDSSHLDLRFYRLRGP